MHVGILLAMKLDYSAWWICVLIVFVNWPVLLEWLQQARLAALPERRGDKAAGRPRAALFDADCGFCRWSVRQILAWDRRGRVHAATIQSEEGERLLAEMPPGRRLESWHLVTPSGRVLSAGAAAPELAQLLPGGRPLAGLFRTFPRATGLAYGWVAAHRGLLAQLLRIDLERERRRR